MKKYIIFGLTLLMAFPLSVVAQDDDTEGEDLIETIARKLTPKQKQYPTRLISGRVLNATTGQPIAGTIISADDVEGYSTLTEEDGTFKLKVPTFTTSVYVNMPDFNPVRLGLQATEQQQVVKLYPQTFSKEYEKTINVRNDYSTNELIFARVVFDIKDLPTEVPEFTKIDLTVLELWTSEPSPSTGLAVDDRNIILVSDGDVSRTKESDSVLVSKYTKLTASTFTEDNIRKSTKDQAVGTEPKSEPVTVPTSVAVVEKSDKGDKNEDDSAFVKTGKWYIALLILAVLIVCSTVLFVMRKRDIYDN